MGLKIIGWQVSVVLLLLISNLSERLGNLGVQVDINAAIAYK